MSKCKAVLDSEKVKEIKVKVKAPQGNQEEPSKAAEASQSK